MSLEQCQEKQSSILSYINIIAVLNPEQVGPEVFLDSEYNLAATIKTNEKLFNFVFMLSTYIKTFMFGEKRLRVQIEAIKNCKSKIAIKTTTFVILATKFLNNGS